MCIIVFLLITTVHVLPHGLLMWLGIWLLKQSLIPSVLLPMSTVSLQVTRRETNIAKTLAIPVPRTLIAPCVGVTLSVQHFYTVLKLSEDALQIICSSLLKLKLSLTCEFLSGSAVALRTRFWDESFPRIASHSSIIDTA